MDQKLDLSGFRITSVSNPVQAVMPVTSAAPSPLGFLADFIGDWRGNGFNQIWRPQRGSTDHFLELNETTEDLQFVEIQGEIPNRGFLQSDINMHGMTYMQTISDSIVKDQNNNPAGLHVEPGLWINVPATTEPLEVATVARLATVPHGASLLAQGTVQRIDGGPQIASVDITPFAIGTPTDKISFGDTNLSAASQFRTDVKDIPNVTQKMVDDPNNVLREAIKDQNIISTVVIEVSTSASSNPNVGGGISNLAFLQGTQSQGPNAQAAQVDATFWIETVQSLDGRKSLQLQYSQLVLLNFNGLSWPHVSVATLRPFDREKNQFV